MPFFQNRFRNTSQGNVTSMGHLQLLGVFVALPCEGAALPHLLGVHQHEEYFLRGLVLHFPQAPMLIQAAVILRVQSDTDDPEIFFL